MVGLRNLTVSFFDYMLSICRSIFPYLKKRAGRSMAIGSRLKRSKMRSKLMCIGVYGWEGNNCEATKCRAWPCYKHARSGFENFHMVAERTVSTSLSPM